jgi:hypothetical protein
VGGGGVQSMKYFYSSLYYLFTYLLHVSVVRPSSSRNIYVGNYTTANGSVFFILINVMDNNSDRFLVIADVVAAVHILDGNPPPP